MMKLMKKNYKGIKEYAEKRKLSMMLNVLKVCGGGIRKCNSFSEKELINKQLNYYYIFKKNNYL